MQVEGAKEVFKKLVKDNIKRDGIEKVIKLLEHSDFYTAPASTQFHDAFRGGLCQHSINVYEYLKEKQSKIGVSDETIAIVSLFHDICKIGYYKETTKNVKNAQGVWEQVPFYMVEDAFPIGHGEKSVILLMECMTLTAEEIMAIRWHMNGFEPKENYSSISKTYTESKLALYLAISDLEATYVAKEKSWAKYK